MTKPPLTEEQKKAYELSLEKIISKCPDWLKHEWNKGPKIFWVDDRPQVNSKVILNLPPNLVSKYEALRETLE